MRSNQQKQKSNTSIISFALMIIAALVIAGINWYSKKNNGSHHGINSNHTHQNKSIQPAESNQHWTFLPTSSGEVIQHAFYSLSYIEKYEQAEWVCYPLTKALLQKPNVPRSDWFNPDPLVSTQSAAHFDYKGSGYTRGHMCPAGDMSFDQTAMEESFYMSNMSPQIRAFNNGIWRELEEQTRDWVYQNKSVIIVSGPIFDDRPAFFKKKRIAIPKAFYKIILDNEGPEFKAIAFIIPHEVSERPLSEYAVSVDQVEQLTKTDFFAKYMPGKMENIESKYDLHAWPISDARYRLRVERWNHE